MFREYMFYNSTCLFTGHVTIGLKLKCHQETKYLHVRNYSETSLQRLHLFPKMVRLK